RRHTRFSRDWSSDVCSSDLGLIASLGVALLLNQNVRGLSLWRVLFYLPAVLPAIATLLLWRWIFSSTGLLNSTLTPLYRLAGIEIGRASCRERVESAVEVEC